MSTRHPGQAPNEAQRGFVKSLPGTNPNGLRRAQQIARQRQQTPYQRHPVWCVSCLGPRDPRKGPVCETCTTKRQAGQR